MSKASTILAVLLPGIAAAGFCPAEQDATSLVQVAQVFQPRAQPVPDLQQGQHDRSQLLAGLAKPATAGLDKPARSVADSASAQVKLAYEKSHQRAGSREDRYLQHLQQIQGSLIDDRETLEKLKEQKDGLLHQLEADQSKVLSAALGKHNAAEAAVHQAFRARADAEKRAINKRLADEAAREGERAGERLALERAAAEKYRAMNSLLPDPVKKWQDDRAAMNRAAMAKDRQEAALYNQQKAVERKDYLQSVANEMDVIKDRSAEDREVAMAPLNVEQKEIQEAAEQDAANFAPMDWQNGKAAAGTPFKRHPRSAGDPLVNSVSSQQSGTRPQLQA